MGTPQGGRSPQLPHPHPKTPGLQKSLLPEVYPNTDTKDSGACHPIAAL
ncbi:hypothetical protein [Laspinema olomoucense]|nr:hypothetical protein [Laspinema sp. D3d]MCT7971388.1 hypothetical protein [Laspinema sp. D3d]